MVDTAERALPVGRYSVPTLDWVRMPAAGRKVEPPVYGLDEILDGVAAAGFQAVGLDDLTVGGLDPADVASALRRRGLLCSEVGILRAGQPRETSAAAHDLTWLAQATGASCCIAIVADPPPADALAALETAAAVLAAGGVRMALEFAAYGSVATLPEAIALCAAWAGSGAGFCSTAGTFSGATTRGRRSSRSTGARSRSFTSTTHRTLGLDPVHDSRFRREPPGAGMLDLERFLDVLSAIGYRGEISLEVLSSRIAATPPAATARELMASIVRGGFAH